MASGDIIFQDTFTETSNTALTSHTPDTGTGWSSVDQVNSGVIHVDATADNAQPSADNLSTGQTVMADATYPSADYQMELTCTKIQTLGDDYHRIFIRYSSQANNGYYAAIISTDVAHDPGIQRATGAASETQICTASDNSAAVLYADGDTLIFEAIGSDIAIYGGTGAAGTSAEVANSYASDANVTAAGKAGFNMGASWLYATADMQQAQQQIDNLTIYEVGDTVYGWNQPSTTGETDNDFINPANVYGASEPDETLCTADWDTGVGTYAQDYGDFGFSIDSGDTIRGISVFMEVYTDASGWNEYAVSLSKNNGSTWTSEKTVRFEDFDATSGKKVLGHARSLWGDTWTPSDFSDANFRIKVRLSDREVPQVDDPGIDWIKVRVITDGGGGGGGIEADGRFLGLMGVGL